MELIKSRLVRLVIAVALAMMVAAPAAALEEPFEPIFEVNPATPSADSPVQIQIVFELPEGNSFIKSASFRIPAEYQVPNSDDIPNGDIVGDGTLALKVGALGNMNISLCAANKSPNLPGAHATIDIAVQIGGGDPSNCSGLLNLTLSLKKFPDGQYGFDFSLPREVVGQQLDTPLQLVVNLYSVTKANSAVNPPTTGGNPVIKNPREPGNYKWTLQVEDIHGRKKELSAPTRVDASTGPRKESAGVKIPPEAFIGGGIAAALVLIAAVAMLKRKKTMARAFANGDYYDDSTLDYTLPHEDNEQFDDDYYTYEDGRAPMSETSKSSAAGQGSVAGGYNPDEIDHDGETVGGSH